jgi:beta-lactamase class A
MRRRALLAALLMDPSGPLDALFERLEQRCGGTLGVAATHVETRRVITWRERERFPMWSVAKLPVAIGVFAQVEAGVLGLHQLLRVEAKQYSTGFSPLRDQHPDGLVCTLEQLLIWSVRDSDNSAHDVLLGLAGGPEAVQKLLERQTGNGIRIDRSERDAIADMKKYGARGFVQQGLDTATPEAMTQLVSLVERRQVLRASSCECLTRWMGETKTGAGRMRARLPNGARVWHKTGTAVTDEGAHIATNDVGVITLAGGRGRIALSLFLRLAKAKLEETERVLAEAAEAVYMVLERSE